MTAAMHEFTLAFPWVEQWDKETAGARGCETVTINALHPCCHYFWPGYPGIYDSRRGIETAPLRARSIVAFMDATGLRRSNARYRVFDYPTMSNPHRGEPPRDAGFDHTEIWTAGRNLYAVTTEPNTDGEDTKAWCAANGWQCHVFPAGIGMWNSYPGWSRLILSSPPKDGIDITPLIPKVLEAMPRWSRSVTAGPDDPRSGQ